jgi:hypothetical protein
VTDLNITEEVVASKNAQSDMGIFVKKIMQNPEFARTTAAYRAIDVYHKKMTVPWNDRAERLLALKSYFDYTDKMRRLKQECESSVHHFLSNFGDLVAAEHSRLGDSFAYEDYPSVEELERKYKVDFLVTPLQNLDDIRVSLPEADLAKMRADCEQVFDHKLQAISHDLWVRLHKSIKRMCDNLEKNSRIYDTMLGNIYELVDMLPTLNVGQDPQLDYMTTEIKERLLSYNTEDIKKDDKVKARATDDANDILDKIDNVLGNMGLAP